MFQSGRGITVLSCVILAAMSIFIAVLAAGIISQSVYGREISEADSYGGLVYLDAEYLTGSFATDEEGNEYLFASRKKGGTWYDYIVSVPKTVYNSDEFQKKIAADNEDASPLRIKGTLRQTDSDLDALAQGAYAIYAGLDSGENASDYLGNVCLVYSASGNALADISAGLWIALAFMVLMIVLWIAEMIRLIRRQRKKDRKIANAKKLFETSADYQNGVRQTSETDARHFKNCRCYVTRDYVVSYQDGLEVFRIDQIRELYGYDKQRYHAILSVMFGAFAGFSMEHYLVAITADGEAHQFARLNAAVKAHSQIAGAILLKNQSIVLGRMNLALREAGQTPDDLNLAKVKGFYGSTDIWTGRSMNSFGIE
ncbi:hypothetical protein [Clostridium vitabionis]|jgi:hypothetical protein|uniref:hypothetical protein n=1 Tax=Clostridium vitabionis TaxID=2784388 RepID=UPI00188C760C|nr:hypothetical protein [Clostridium vitabionis]